MKMLVAVNEPNKIVTRAFDFLSCKHTTGALAGRSIAFLELLAPLRFLHKSICGRWDVHAIGLQAIDSLSKGLPRGHFKVDAACVCVHISYLYRPSGRGRCRPFFLERKKGGGCVERGREKEGGRETQTFPPFLPIGPSLS
jgi:hypothetical protein